MTGSDPRPSLSRRATALAVLCLAALAALLPAGPAAAAPGEGQVAIAVNGQRAELPVVGVRLLEAATVRTRGVLKLPVSDRTVPLRRVLVQIAGRRAALSAKLGKRRLVFLRARGPVQLDAGSVELRAAKLWLTRRAARLLRRKLGMPGLRPGRLGRISVRAALAPATPVPMPTAVLQPPQPKDKEIAPPEKPDPEPNPDPFSESCAIGAGDPGGFGAAPVAPNPPQAEPVLSDPFTLTDGLLGWGFKSSFRGYVLGTQEPGSAGAIDTFDGAQTALDGSFEFSGNGEYVRKRSAQNDQLILDGAGGALFCKAAHLFHVALENPTVIVDGEDSRLVVDAAANRAGEWYEFQRADFASLDLSGIRPSYSVDGLTATWADVPATMTEDGAKVSGLYPAGTPLDPVTVSASIDVVPDLYADTCGPFSNPTVTPGPELPETPQALPDLDGATDVVGGSAQWGIHTPFRNQIVSDVPPGSAGTLQTFEGATYSAPTFTYPAASGLYDEGAADPGDDTLVLHGGGIALLCKPAHGYRYAISNPTVVIDGAESRLVVDMDLRINGLIDPSVRSDFATLDMTGIVPTVDGDTITWTSIPVTLTQNGSEAINNRYPAGTVLDPITVSATLP